MQKTRFLKVTPSAAVKPRTGTFENREYLIVPVVALVEGVIQAMNSPTPEFVPAEEFSKFPASWNGRPVVVDHPVMNGEPVSANSPDVLEGARIGYIFNAALKKGKLAMEAWIDVERAGELEPEMLARLEAGDPIEISVGLFCETDDSSGVYNGKKFAGTWKDLVPDHLALLSKGSTGACSREMGCGVRAAKGETPMEHMYDAWLEQGDETRTLLKALRNIPQSERDKMPAGDFAGPNRSFPIAIPGDVADAAQSIGRAKGNRASIKSKIISIAYRKGDTFVAQLPEEWKKKKDQKSASMFGRLLEMFRGAQPANQMGNNDLRRKLGEALAEKEPGVYCMTEDWYPVTDPTHVVYSVMDMTDGGAYPYTMYERPFTLDADGVVTLGDMKIEVEPVMNYEPVEGAGPIAAEEAKPCSCKTKTAKSQETDMSKETIVKALETASPEQIKAMTEAFEGTNPAVKAAAEATAKATADVKAANDKAAADVKAAQDKAAADVKAAQEDPEYVAFKAAQETKRTATIKTLKDTGRCKLTDEQLKAMSQGDLDNLVALAGQPKVATDFSGQAPRAAEEGEQAAPAAPDMAGAIKAARAKK